MTFSIPVDQESIVGGFGNFQTNNYIVHHVIFKMNYFITINRSGSLKFYLKACRCLLELEGKGRSGSMPGSANLPHSKGSNNFRTQGIIIPRELKV